MLRPKAGSQDTHLQRSAASAEEVMGHIESLTQPESGIYTFRSSAMAAALLVENDQ